MQTKTLPTTFLLGAASSIILFIGLFLAAGASAATITEKEAKFDTIYEQLLVDPANIDLTLEYAALAVDIGDYEAAIPPMERLLIQNPGAHKLKLELGVLYYLLGSYSMAKTYLGEVNSAADAPSPLKAQAQSYLIRM